MKELWNKLRPSRHFGAQILEEGVYLTWWLMRWLIFCSKIPLVKRVEHQRLCFERASGLSIIACGSSDGIGGYIGEGAIENSPLNRQLDQGDENCPIK